MYSKKMRPTPSRPKIQRLKVKEEFVSVKKELGF